MKLLNHREELFPSFKVSVGNKCQLISRSILTHVFLIVSIVFYLSGCSSEQAKIPEQKTENYYHLYQYYILVSSAQMEQGYTIEVEGVKYQVVNDESDTAQYLYVSTADSGFITAENVKIGKHYKDLIDPHLISERGWAVYTKLESGWNAAFKLDSTYKDVTTDSTIQWFFRRNVPKTKICPNYRDHFLEDIF